MDSTVFDEVTAPGQWWSLGQARAVLAEATPKSRRSVERRIKLLLGWPESPTVAEIESGAAMGSDQDNPLLIRHAIRQARRKRHRVLIVQLGRLSDGRPCLHAYDARSTRFWFVFTEKSPTRQQLTLAMQTLKSLHPRGVLTLPHGELAKYLQSEDQASSSGHLNLPDLGQPRTTSPLDRDLFELESESIHIVREAIAGAKNPVLLFSAGKDSAVLLHLVRKAFYPALPPLPMLHVDTRWKFRAMYTYRDQIAQAAGLELRVHINPQAIADDINPFDHGPTLHTDITKTQALRQALDIGSYDIIIAGARRDEEKSRAKERRFSIRAPGHRWDPRRQRPEPWNLYHTGLGRGESLRVFPLSNWTELDVWRYIDHEQLPLVDLYFSAPRPVVQREGQLIVIDDARFRLTPHDQVEYRNVRFRSLGCYPLTAAVESQARTVKEIIKELLMNHQSERVGRVIDKDQSGSMELKKREGYF